MTEAPAPAAPEPPAAAGRPAPDQAGRNRPERPDRATPPGERTKWYRRPWIVPLFAVAGLFVAARLPFYLTFDTSDSLVELQDAFPETHYLMLSGHILFGSIAIITCSMQVWTWLRLKHPKVHRVSGRLYVFAGVLPSGVFALVVSIMSVIGPAGKIGNVMLSLLWFGTTFAGFLAARRHDFQAHRRWMIRSFALCWSIVVNRVWIALLIAVLLPFEESYYGGDTDALVTDVAVASIWLSWVVNLMIAQWWLDRRPARRGRRPGPTKVAAAA
ncbi:DUF2306 domain-containing protein [Glycomyces albidus]|uniref:DUF2306 domain-containing protein n=1 Tax=Glycomyces albidus TaxID=2656774 RepID=A0A6L5GBQ4_9ACTN|nr:DUF2306 domain-containing protein [Glycomyces albidus]MQM27122.1 DUF2306 domain-containing protein [Glycomyces albidus]